MARINRQQNKQKENKRFYNVSMFLQLINILLTTILIFLHLWKC
jgi:hypothetical protein